MNHMDLKFLRGLLVVKCFLGCSNSVFYFGFCRNCSWWRLWFC